MRKLAWQLGDDIQQERPRSKLPLIALVALLVIGLGPLLLEGGAICLANWKEFMGISAEVRTPWLDFVQNGIENMKDTFWYQITPFFRHLPWDPTMVLPAAALVMAVAMLLLRR
jgi:hypothetical protein